MKIHLKIWLGTLLLMSASLVTQAEESKGIDTSVEACQGLSTEDCVIRQYKDSPEASMIRGKVVFMTYCVLCHGPTGEGNGRAAKLYTPKPANFTKSVLSLEYFRQIVPKGGEAMGRNKGMPAWSDQLTDEQIKDVTFYAFSLRTKKSDVASSERN